MQTNLHILSGPFPPRDADGATFPHVRFRTGTVGGTRPPEDVSPHRRGPRPGPRRPRRRRDRPTGAELRAERAGEPPDPPPAGNPRPPSFRDRQQEARVRVFAPTRRGPTCRRPAGPRPNACANRGGRTASPADECLAATTARRRTQREPSSGAEPARGRGLPTPGRGDALRDHHPDHAAVEVRGEGARVPVRGRAREGAGRVERGRVQPSMGWTRRTRPSGGGRRSRRTTGTQVRTEGRATHVGETFRGGFGVDGVSNCVRLETSEGANRLRDRPHGQDPLLSNPVEVAVVCDEDRPFLEACCGMEDVRGVRGCDVPPADRPEALVDGDEAALPQEGSHEPRGGLRPKLLRVTEHLLEPQVVPYELDVLPG